MKKQPEKRIYLDHAASTPIDRRVLRVMEEVSGGVSGNPSSLHAEGVLAKNVLENARKTVATALQAHPDEIVFTTGGTEANNLALFGTAGDVSKAHIIVSAIEHPSVLECARELERRGAEVTYLSVSSEGLVSSKEVKEALRKNTRLVSVMYANNEIGTIQPIGEIAKIIRRHNAAGGKTIFHTDACQAMNYLDVNVLRLGVDLMTVNASKIYGPKGVGALFAKRGVPLASLVFGGGQERGVRSGTENIPGIAGFAEAVWIAEEMKGKESERLVKLRDLFISEVLEKIPDTVLNGSASARLPNNANISFLGSDAEEIVILLDARGVATSTGSACANIGRIGKVSDIVLALDKDRIRAAGAVRFTLGRSTTRKDIADAVRAIVSVCERMKG